jgi:hypothetical protein
MRIPWFWIGMFIACLVIAGAIVDGQCHKDKTDYEYQQIPTAAAVPTPHLGSALVPAGLGVGGLFCSSVQMRVDIFCGSQPNGCKGLRWTAVPCWLP